MPPEGRTLSSLSRRMPVQGARSAPNGRDSIVRSLSFAEKRRPDDRAACTSCTRPPRIDSCGSPVPVMGTAHVGARRTADVGPNFSRAYGKRACRCPASVGPLVVEAARRMRIRIVHRRKGVDAPAPANIALLTSGPTSGVSADGPVGDRCVPRARPSRTPGTGSSWIAPFSPSLPRRASRSPGIVRNAWAAPSCQGCIQNRMPDA